MAEVIGQLKEEIKDLKGGLEKEIQQNEELKELKEEIQRYKEKEVIKIHCKPYSIETVIILFFIFFLDFSHHQEIQDQEIRRLSAENRKWKQEVLESSQSSTIEIRLNHKF